MKKFIGLILAVLLVSVFFAGCGNNSGAGGITGKTPAEGIETPADADDASADKTTNSEGENPGKTVTGSKNVRETTTAPDTSEREITAPKIPGKVVTVPKISERAVTAPKTPEEAAREKAITEKK